MDFFEALSLKLTKFKGKFFTNLEKVVYFIIKKILKLESFIVNKINERTKRNAIKEQYIKLGKLIYKQSHLNEFQHILNKKPLNLIIKKIRNIKKNNE